MHTIGVDKITLFLKMLYVFSLLGCYKFYCMSVQYDKYIYYNQHYAHDWSG